jgi:hypothetical protein
VSDFIDRLVSIPETTRALGVADRTVRWWAQIGGAILSLYSAAVIKLLSRDYADHLHTHAGTIYPAMRLNKPTTACHIRESIVYALYLINKIYRVCKIYFVDAYIASALYSWYEHAHDST